MFFADRASAEKADPSAGYWLNFSDNIEPEASRQSNAKFALIYKVVFSGHRSDEPGVYGPGLDNLKGGILADRIVSATLVGKRPYLSN
jgi:hypothetical protein